MASINLISNHLSEVDKDNIADGNYSNSKESTIVVPESYNDKDQLVDGGNSNEKNDFVQIYNKIWPFRFIKMANWVIF